jgi:hypothetical protein
MPEKNIIVGNAAGAFSTFLKFLAWRVASDIEYNNLNVQYHWINKTDFGGCGFIADYHRSYGKHALIDYSFQRKDLIKHLFNIENKDLTQTYDEYLECYPDRAIDLLNISPASVLFYRGGGYLVEQYYKEEFLSKIRNDYNCAWKFFELSDYMKERLEKESEIIKNKKVLTVMVRCSAHYIDLKTKTDFKSNVDLKNKFRNSSLEEVKYKFEHGKYDNILLLTNR